MKFCTSCNQDRTGDKFCTVCGTEFGAASNTETFTMQKARTDPPRPATEKVTRQPPPGQPPAGQAYAETQLGAAPAWGPTTPSQPSWGQPGADQPATQTYYSGSGGPTAQSQPAAGGYPPPGQYTPPGQYPAPGQYPQPGQYTPPGQYPAPDQYPAPGQYAGGQYPAPDQYTPPGQYPAPGTGGAGVRLRAQADGGPRVGRRGGRPRRGRGRVRPGVVAAPWHVDHAARPGGPRHRLGRDHAEHRPGPDDTPPTTATTAATTPSSAKPSGTVTLSQAAASSSSATQVQSLFNRYFNSINTRNYSEYSGTLDATMQANNSKSHFDSGYSTTTDSNEVINSITDNGDGSLTANVSFTSTQDPADSVDNSSCNNWTLNLPLVAQGSGYVLSPPPSGYATYTDC